MVHRKFIIDNFPITRCEMEIIGLVVRGFNRRQIAIMLHKSRSTLNNQLHYLFKKLKVRKINGLFYWAMTHGFDRQGNYTRGKEVTVPVEIRSIAKIFSLN